jgi:tetratricopeptide (TPR) repeat protein
MSIFALAIMSSTPTFANQEAHLNFKIGMHYKVIKQYAKSKKYLQKALNFCSSDKLRSNIHYNLAEIYFVKKLYVHSNMSMKQAIKLNPKHKGSGYALMGISYRNLKKYKDSLFAFHKSIQALKKYGDPQNMVYNSYYEQSVTMVKAHLYVYAKVSVKKALKLKPGHKPSLNLLKQLPK